ncbi:LuxR family transcriptional regulator [Rhizobium deserti]|uniref:LuxR family transcriptional regulator n=1 Tax=Rhizobium deserti TaxID=2547961 RepID=A0A4R5UMT4_9HYPH|nr:LuxR family transcriptional regulator [Rhizobium deserti]TDK39058.1 LuxR family transcriptional regulator [Rhizobium deserti]
MITLERQSILSSEISAADSRTGISSALARITHEFGFRYFMLVKVPPADEVLLARSIVDTNLPRDYIREFDRRRLLRKCPLSPILAEFSLPYCWVLDERDHANGLPFPPELAELQRQYEMTTSLAMAMHSVDSTGFRIRIDGSRPRLTQVEINEIGMILLHAFGVFDKIRRADKGVSAPLTTRELEVVRWTAQGKTSAEIGQILSLSDHTVNAYMTNAIKKLDCVNRTQLVAKALRLRLII